MQLSHYCIFPKYSIQRQLDPSLIELRRHACHIWGSEWKIERSECTSLGHKENPVVSVHHDPIRFQTHWFAILCPLNSFSKLGVYSSVVILSTLYCFFTAQRDALLSQALLRSFVWAPDVRVWF